MIFVRDVDTIDFDDAVTFSQSCSLSRTLVVHLPDELSTFRLLGVQVEAIAVEVGPLDQVTEARGGCVRRQTRLLSHLSVADDAARFECVCR